MSDLREQLPVEAHRQSTAELVRQASEQVSHLIKEELRLFRIEMMAKRKQATTGIGLFGAAGFLALYGVAALLATAILGLATVLPAWLAALIVAVVVLAVAGIMALIAKASVKKAAPAMPEETVASIKADIDEVRERAHR
jgi:VIT1/CCC1 family predicted Fe2+/Mn2+ transporter